MNTQPQPQTQSPRKKNFKIEAFKHKVELDPKYAKRTWKVLEHVIHEIYNNNASLLSFEELYRSSFSAQPSIAIVPRKQDFKDPCLFTDIGYQYIGTQLNGCNSLMKCGAWLMNGPNQLLGSVTENLLDRLQEE